MVIANYGKRGCLLIHIFDTSYILLIEAFSNGRKKVKSGFTKSLSFKACNLAFAIQV
jgi:hypothetical protein